MSQASSFVKEINNNIKYRFKLYDNVLYSILFYITKIYFSLYYS